MKKSLLIGCVLCLLLSGCGYRQEVGESLSKEPSDATTIPPHVDSSGVASEDAAAARIAYYEALTKELQEEILALKTELYTCRVSYEEQIAILTGKGSEPDEEVFEYEIQNGRAILIAYHGSAKEVRIPQTLGGYPLSAIGSGAFENNATLCSVILPDGIGEIGWFAFSGCVSLSSVQIPSSVQSIGYAAFHNCKASLTVLARQNTYAVDYAESYGIRVSFLE